MIDRACRLIDRALAVYVVASWLFAALVLAVFAPVVMLVALVRGLRYLLDR